VINSYKNFSYYYGLSLIAVLLCSVGHNLAMDWIMISCAIVLKEASG
jgi:hypothetical protein